MPMSDNNSDRPTLGSMPKDQSDRDFLLGQIAAIVRELPDRMSRFERQTEASLTSLHVSSNVLTQRIEDSNEKLSDKMQKAIEVLQDRVGKVEKKTNAISGAVAAITSMAAGLATLWWHRGGA